MDTYQFTVAVGDVVEQSNGQLAVVADCEILCCGHVKQITLMPLTPNPFAQLAAWIPGNRPCDEAINRLTKVGTVLG